MGCWNQTVCGRPGQPKLQHDEMDHLILAPDSLWPVWAENDMYKNVDILTLTPDSLWAVQADTRGLCKIGIRE